MRRLAFLFALLLAVPCFGQTVVQSINSSEASNWPQPAGSPCLSAACTTSPNFASAVTVGNYIIVIPFACQVDCSATSTDVISSVVDTQANTFSACAKLTGTQTYISGEIWYAKIGTGGTDAVTAICNGCAHQPAFGGVFAYEISGISATTPCDATGTLRATVSGTTQALSTSGTTTQANELSIAIGHTGTGCTNPPTGYTSLPLRANEFASKTLAATGTQTATWTGCTNGDVFEGAIATFKLTGAAVSSAPRLMLIGVGP